MRFGESRRKQRMIWWRYPKHGFHIHKLLQNNGVPLVLKCCLPAPAHQLTPLNYRGWDGGPRSQAGRGRPVLRRASGRPEPVGSELHPSAGWARAPKAAERQHRQGELSPDKLGCFRGKPNTFEPLGFRSTAPEATPPPAAPSSVLHLLQRHRGPALSPQGERAPGGGSEGPAHLPDRLRVLLHKPAARKRANIKGAGEGEECHSGSERTRRALVGPGEVRRAKRRKGRDFGNWPSPAPPT